MKATSCRLLLILCIMLSGSVFVPRLAAIEIGFDEEYCLAEDRAVPLKQLIPGTEDYYYYHCLYHQQRGETSQVANLLKQWVNRYSHSQRYEEIRTRQVLLDYAQNPERIVRFIIERLNLQFNHARKQAVARKSFSSRLPEEWLSYQTLKATALREYNDLSGFKYPGIEALMHDDLTGDRRRDLLNRLQYPDGERLAQMVVDDLQHQYSGGFGSLAIHGRLLPEQLEFCSRAMPQLLEQTPFVMAWLQKMLPGADAAWETDATEKLMVLQRMYKFVSGLKPVFNSLKAHLLYHILDTQRSSGVYDRKMFFEYLNLPRNAAYYDQKLMQSNEWRYYKADLHADFQKSTLCQPVRNDEPLVRDFLSRLMLAEKSSDAFAGIIESEYLKRLLAETMIVNAAGDLEKWFSMLDGQAVKNLRERVELEFLPGCKPVYDTTELVKLMVRVKNVNRLMVKIYKLNLANYYRENAGEVSTAIDLDGLVANEELSYDYQFPAYQRHEETFELKNLTGRGVYIVELIGNGTSSRAMLRRGQLSFVQKTGAAGHIFSVFDENGQQVQDASLMLAGSEYTADNSGKIVVPFTTNPGNRQFILRHGDFAALHNFEHQNEVYNLEAAFHVDREALLSGRVAKVLIRPALSVNLCPVDIGLLKDTVLLITSLDRDGVESTREVKDFKLVNASESAYEFKVPDKLRAISFSLRGRIDNLSQGRKDDLQVAKRFDLNGIDSTEKTEAFFVRNENDEYVVELLGKSGEPCADRVINIEIAHRLISRIISGTLQTDEQGRIVLGRLENVESVKLNGPDNLAFHFVPAAHLNNLPDIICSQAGQEIKVPLSGSSDEKISDLCCLYEIRNGTPVKDCRPGISLEPGFYVIKGLPAGDYEMYLKRQQLKIQLKIADGNVFGGYVISKRRGLPLNNAKPLQITSARMAEDGKFLIKLANSGKDARVHIIASSFLPEFKPFAGFAALMGPAYPEIMLNQPISRYVSGRNIGDEYRYILERKFARIFPGNMLKRPGLLLNPWSLRKTDTGTQEAAAGGVWGGAPEVAGQRSAGSGIRREKGQAGLAQSGFASYDFLAEPSLLLANLKPAADGSLSIDAGTLKNHSILQIVAVDGFDVVCRELPVQSVTPGHLDLRMKNIFPPEQHFSEQKNIVLLAASETLEIKDISTAKIEVYDSLKSVYQFLTTINPDANMVQFGFVTGWASLDEKKKLELYSKYACHELNFFIFRRDNQFFEKYIKPYIARKRDKTFIDKWLLGQDLKNYMEPWAFSRLNIVEKILLGQRLPEMGPTIERHVREKFDLLADDREKFNSLFKTALQGNAMATGDTLGLEEGRQNYEKMRGDFSGLDMPAPEPSVAVTGRAAKPMSLARPFPPPAPSMAKAKSRMRESKKESFADFDDGAMDEEVADSISLESESQMRDQVRQLFRQVDKTEEWVENNYYQQPIENQLADLIQVNAFWSDYAASKPDKPFISGNFIFATGNFAEMMLALAVLDLPFEAGKHLSDFNGPQMTLQAGNNAVVFLEQIKQARESAEGSSILTGQNFFAQNDRYRYEKNERFDKFVSEEFLVRVVYGCQVVVTNPTSSRRKVDVLMQIPEGAMPVFGSLPTRSIHLQIEPYSTRTSEYFFYFPRAGNWRHYPVHVSENEIMLAATRPFNFKVVDELTSFDKTSWPWLSQNGSDAEVLEFLNLNNIERLDMTQIAFRLKNLEFFLKVIELLRSRHAYNNVIWSYALHHKHAPTMREYLPHSAIAGQVGSSFVCDLFEIRPVERHTYQHREYWPLVNARVYPLGKKPEILNKQFADQYHALLADLRYRSRLSDNDLIAVVYYLLLQDRIELASAFFARISDMELQSTIQYRYMKAYLAFYHGQVAEAVKIAEPFKDYPVQRWQALFADVLAQAAEIEGARASISDEEDRDQQQRMLADSQPDIELAVENRLVTLRHRNLKMVKISYYLMDIELLFSRKPFVQEVSGQFSIITPNHSEEIKLEGREERLELALPEQFRDKNMMIEVAAAGLNRTAAYYPHSLAVSMIEKYGQLQVRHQQTGKPLPQAYVKVYAKNKDGQVAFYKDGYTDLRGKFDYASLSTSQLDNVEKFSILISSETAGSLIKEADTPDR